MIAGICIYICHWVRGRPSTIVRAIRTIFWPLWRHSTKTRPLPKGKAQNCIRIYRAIDGNSFDWHIWAVSASDFFTDSYKLFAANVILPSLAFIYWNKHIILASIFLAVTLVGAGLETATSVPWLPQSKIEHKLTQITPTGATQIALSPVSDVLGVGFNRIVQIWLENSVHARNLSLLASRYRICTDG